MPKDNIERAIKRGTGDLEGQQFEEITYEGYWLGRRRHSRSTCLTEQPQIARRARFAKIFERAGGKDGHRPARLAYQFERKRASF